MALCPPLFRMMLLNKLKTKAKLQAPTRKRRKKKKIWAQNNWCDGHDETRAEYDKCPHFHFAYGL